MIVKTSSMIQQLYPVTAGSTITTNLIPPREASYYASQPHLASLSLPYGGNKNAFSSLLFGHNAPMMVENV